ncbi:MAG: histidinol-phosphatase HisJ family protein [Oscillospiraceae bacterium]|nr:histidinol-phosphatase HisJ family protein [Oscillospiraceae bacterium]
MYTNLFDSHTHSENSPDGNHSVLNMCEQAADIGLSGIAITDHLECNDFIKDNYRTRVQQSVFDIRRAQQLLGDKLLISCGIELGQALQNKDAALEILNTYDFDFVLGSLHALEGKLDFCYWDYSDPNIIIHDSLVDYYKQQIDLAKWGHFDVMGHITYPIRYIWGKNRIPVDITRYSDLIDELLRTLIEKGRGIEVNTSGLRQELGTTLPDFPLIKRYRELGGEIITIGTDAHFVEDIGNGVEYTMDMLREAGFEYFSFFKGRQPRMLKLA